MSGLSRMAILGALMATAGAPVMASQVAIEQRAVSPMRALAEAMSAVRVSDGFNYRNGPGWTAARVKRMATKRRNQQRHKAAARKSSKGVWR